MELIKNIIDLFEMQLKKNNVSIGDYLVNAYQELDKGSPNFQRIKTIRFSR